MPDLVGVRFQRAGRIYYFDAAGFSLNINDSVVAETSRGAELGKVVILPTQILAGSPSPNETLKPIIRQATENDLKLSEQRQPKNQKALSICRELVTKLNLDMKPISAQYNLDSSHVTIFFIAEQRIDFRELVRELSRNLRTNVELRQVGARDETKILGGLGKCGLPLCCNQFLVEFSPVSIKMAKEQDLTLGPTKTSGNCNRLLCCLGYEFEQYKALKEKLPSIGTEVNTQTGKGKVVGINPIKEAVSVELQSGVTVEMTLEEIDELSRKQQHRGNRHRN